MKIVVLGNGFDRANGLPTAYSQFFKYIEKKNINFYTEFNNFLNKKFHISKFKNANEVGRIKYSSSEEYFSLFKNELDVIEEYFDEIVKNIEVNKISFWEIYFWFLNKTSNGEDIKLWNSVEDDIYSFLNNDDKTNKYTIGYMNSLENNIDIKQFDSNLLNKSDDLLFGVHNWDKIVILTKKLNGSNKLTFEFFFDNLRTFEDSFKVYINLIMSDLVYSRDKKSNQKIYKDNFLKLIESNEENDYFLLNFNYTSFSWVEYEKNRKVNHNQNIYFFSRDKIEHRIIETNVHGNCREIVIFGIDQSDLSGDSEIYIFTKTYRKISDSDKLVSNPLPKISEIDEIIFYGHSLSEADYSYFQSIFDYFDIYHSNIVLTFKYSFYGDESEYRKLKKTQLLSVSSLIKSYGNSMDNDELGKNLIHKLLLENRLNVSRVSLEEINTDEFEKKYLNLITLDD